MAGIRGLVAAALTLAAPPALANGPDCGGDAFSSGVVVEHRLPRRGSIVARPETLCADVEDVNRPQVGIELYGTVSPGPDGRQAGSAPYEGQRGPLPGRVPVPFR